MQKSSRIAEISTKVVGGYFFYVHAVHTRLHIVTLISTLMTVSTLNFEAEGAVVSLTLVVADGCTDCRN